MIERSKNIILSMPEYYTLKRRFFSGLTPEVVVEYFYDNTDYEMRKMGLTMSITENADGFFASISERQKEWDEYSIINKVRVNERSDDEAFTAIGLSFQGKMTTVRYLLQLSESSGILLDQNIYLGKTDFELVILFSDNSERQVALELAYYALYLYKEKIISDIESFTNRYKMRKSKSSRFFNRKKMIDRGHY